LLSFLATVIFAILYGGGSTDNITQPHAFFVSGMYLILAILLAVFGWKLLYLVSVINVKVPFLRGKLQITAMTVTLVFVFSSRAIKDFLSGLNIGEIDFGNPDTEPISKQILLFFLFFVWEVIPAFLVIGLFWRIPNTAAVKSRTISNSTNNNQSSTYAATSSNPNTSTEAVPAYTKTPVNQPLPLNNYGAVNSRGSNDLIPPSYSFGKGGGIQNSSNMSIQNNLPVNITPGEIVIESTSDCDTMLGGSLLNDASVVSAGVYVNPRSVNRGGVRIPTFTLSKDTKLTGYSTISPLLNNRNQDQ